MSIDLTIANPISEILQPVQDQDSNASALAISTNSVMIKGQDVAGSALPLVVEGVSAPQGATTYGRLIRLSGNGTFFDIGIDTDGRLFLTTQGAEHPSQHVLTVSKDGVITLGASGALTIK